MAVRRTLVAPDELDSLNQLQKLLGYPFRDLALLRQALCHKSAEFKPPSKISAHNERLEFLGDRVLGLVIAETLFHRAPAENEGKLARRLTTLVNQAVLAEIARDLALPNFLVVGKAAQGDQVTLRDGPLSDALEAIIGAIWLDGGLVAAKKFITTHWHNYLDEKTSDRRDAKTQLQEWAMARGLALPHYAEHKRIGPDHAPQFVVAASLPGFDPVLGQGSNKKRAEKAAAEALYRQVSLKKSNQPLNE
ncbi:MAG: ribonuclease III [Candidatus Symbiobacter sp.]|nr:ribonuclease III [Candidatus Symbiobacter sp.]